MKGWDNGGAYEYYQYETNLQGDVIGLWNKDGDGFLFFEYDAWGNISMIFDVDDDFLQAILFFYRGYIYDTDTGLYYLQTRYYDPETGRFINADSYINANGDLVGYNMFAYCSNNPIMNVDPTGTTTFTISFTFSISFFGWGGTYGIGITTDESDLIAIQATKLNSNDKPFNSFGVGIGLGVNFQWTNYDYYTDLTKDLTYSGFNSTLIGYDTILDENYQPVGAAFGLGPYAGLETHINKPQTTTLVTLKSGIAWLKEWWWHDN